MVNGYETDREFFNGNRVVCFATSYSNGVVCEDCVEEEPEDMKPCTMYQSKCKFCGEMVTVSTMSQGAIL